MVASYYQMMNKLNQRLKKWIRNNFSPHVGKYQWKEISNLKGIPEIVGLFNKKINDDIIHVMEFQRDKYWENEKGKFCLNLGVYHKIYHMKYGYKQDGIIDSSYCFIRERLGNIKFGEDKWYTIDQSTDMEKFSEILISDFDNYAEKWFNNLLTNDHIIKWLKAKNDNLILYMHLINNDKAKAKKTFRELAYKRIDREGTILKHAIEEGLLNKESIENFKLAMIQSSDQLIRRLDEIFKKEDDKQ